MRRIHWLVRIVVRSFHYCERSRISEECILYSNMWLLQSAVFFKGISCCLAADHTRNLAYKTQLQCVVQLDRNIHTVWFCACRLLRTPDRVLMQMSTSSSVMVSGGTSRTTSPAPAVMTIKPSSRAAVTTPPAACATQLTNLNAQDLTTSVPERAAEHTPVPISTAAQTLLDSWRAAVLSFAHMRSSPLIKGQRSA
jgi:hypothetical protein